MKSFVVKTQSREECLDITTQTEKAVRDLRIEAGTCTLYVPHTTAAIAIQETADPAVKEDILDAVRRLIPHSLEYKHLEGNAHAHIQASLIGNSVIVPVENGKLRLGTWQGVIFFELDGPRERNVWIIPSAGA